MMNWTNGVLNIIGSNQALVEWWEQEKQTLSELFRIHSAEDEKVSQYLADGDDSILVGFTLETAIPEEWLIQQATRYCELSFLCQYDEEFEGHAGVIEYENGKCRRNHRYATVIEYALNEVADYGGFPEALDAIMEQLAEVYELSQGVMDSSFDFHRFAQERLASFVEAGLLSSADISASVERSY